MILIEQNITNQHEHKKYLINVIKMLNGNNKNNDQTITIDDEDINDAIINGLTETELLSIINEHTYTGLQAELEFMTWRKL